MPSQNVAFQQLREFAEFQSSTTCWVLRHTRCRVSHLHPGRLRYISVDFCVWKHIWFSPWPIYRVCHTRKPGVISLQIGLRPGRDTCQAKRPWINAYSLPFCGTYTQLRSKFSYREHEFAEFVAESNNKADRRAGSSIIFSYLSWYIQFSMDAQTKAALPSICIC